MTNVKQGVIECDVLVIGGGLAGCWAALRAKDLVDDVVLVEKGKVSRSGVSPFCGGHLLCPTDKDDLRPWMKEIVERGEYINDQEWVEVLLPDLIKRIRELDSFGPLIEKNERGDFNRFVGRANVETRMVIFDALKTMETLRGLLQDKGVTIQDRVMVTDLLTGDGCHPTKAGVIGCVGFNTRTAEPLTVKARGVVVATGGAGFGDDTSGNSGDGIAQAFRAGAEISGMEFARWWAKWTFEKRFKAGHLSMWQALNWILTNAKGERFMDEYFPTLKERAREQDLGAALGKEYIEGRGPVYADFRHVNLEGFEWAKRSASQGHIMRAFESVGIDLGKQTVRYDLCPGFLSFYSGSCGIRTNTYCETSLPGLYAAGQAGGYPAHGTYSVGGLNTAMCCVMGYRAGEFAAKYAREGIEARVDTDQVRSLHDVALHPLQVKKGVKAVELRQMIGDFMSSPRMAFFRHEKRLREGLAEIAKWEAMLPQLWAENPHELIKANGVKSYIQAYKLSFIASLERKESRGANLREDYPYTDNVDFLKRFLLARGNGEVIVRMVPIPIYRYPVKLERYERVPYPFPMPKIEA